MQWYTLKEKVPPTDKFVLVLTKFEKYQKYYLCWYNSKTGNFQLKDYDDMPMKANTVRAWTEIPEY